MSSTLMYKNVDEAQAGLLLLRDYRGWRSRDYSIGFYKQSTGWCWYMDRVCVAKHIVDMDNFTKRTQEIFGYAESLQSGGFKTFKQTLEYVQICFQFIPEIDCSSLRKGGAKHYLLKDTNIHITRKIVDAKTPCWRVHLVGNHELDNAAYVGLVSREFRTLRQTLAYLFDAEIISLSVRPSPLGDGYQRKIFQLKPETCSLK